MATHFVVANAVAFRSPIDEFGSFQAYVDSFRPNESLYQVVALKRDLERRLSYLGDVTSSHFLTDIGLPVLEPDRVLCRIFYRLGLTSDETDIQETERQGRRFAEETGQPIRYIDIVFVAYGQVQSDEFRIDKGICLKNPHATSAAPRPTADTRTRTQPGKHHQKVAAGYTAYLKPKRPLSSQQHDQAGEFGVVDA